MPDRLTPEQRRRCMQGNRSKGTRIETILGKELWSRGLRYRKNDKSVTGTPDFSFKSRKIAVFCDGEFWHGKDWQSAKQRIKSNQAFWHAKIERNMARDQKTNSALKAAGWTVMRFWETDIRKRTSACADEIESVWRERELTKLRNTYAYDTQYDTYMAADDEAEYQTEEIEKQLT